MKITNVTRFDDVILGEDNTTILQEYHGYAIEIGSFIGRCYDGSDEITIATNASKDCDNPVYDEIQKLLWMNGYVNVLYLGENGYDTIANIRKIKWLPRDCYGNPKRTGPPCPNCGIRLYRIETKQCDCGWSESI